MWLAAAQYRVGASLLQGAWDRCAAELKQLFGAARSVEVERLGLEHAVAATYLDAQRACFAALPASLDHADLAALTPPADAAPVDYGAKVDAAVAEAAARLAAERRRAALEAAARAPDAPRSSPPQPRPTASGGASPPRTRPGAPAPAPAAPAVANPAPPLSSPLLVATFLADKKTNMRRWKPVLLCVTADAYLRRSFVFEVPGSMPSRPEDSSRRVGNVIARLRVHRDVNGRYLHAFDGVPDASDAAAAFARLVPKTDDCLRGDAAAFSNPFGNQARPPLAPIDTLDLCETDARYARAFVELVETVTNSGARTLLGKTSARKLNLRLRDADAAGHIFHLVQAANALTPR
jgi:hypothetical protein